MISMANSISGEVANAADQGSWRWGGEAMVVAIRCRGGGDFGSIIMFSF